MVDKTAGISRETEAIGQVMIQIYYQNWLTILWRLKSYLLSESWRNGEAGCIIQLQSEPEMREANGISPSIKSADRRRWIPQLKQKEQICLFSSFFVLSKLPTD